MTATRTCPECGARFQPTNGRQRFCTSAHKQAFEVLNGQRGRLAMSLVQVWRQGKNGKTEDTAYAFAQLCALADEWNKQDKAAGRNPALVVAEKRRQGWAAQDAFA